MKEEHNIHEEEEGENGMYLYSNPPEMWEPPEKSFLNDSEIHGL